jgi:hypothetical protein
LESEDVNSYNLLNREERLVGRSLFRVRVTLEVQVMEVECDSMDLHFPSSPNG